MKYFCALSLLAFLSSCSDSSFKGDGSSGAVPNKSPTPPSAVTESGNASSAASNNVGQPNSTYAPPSQTVNGNNNVPTKQNLDQLALACQNAGVNLKVLEQSLSYAERVGCAFKDSTVPDNHDGHLGPDNGHIQVALDSTQTLNLPSGTICDIAIESVPGASLKYDDMLVLSLDNFALFASTVDLLPFMDQINGAYVWDVAKALTKKPASFGGESYCIGDAVDGKNTGKSGLVDDCTIPDTEDSGPVAIKLNNTKIGSVALAIAGKKSVPLTLTAMGDNDATDCSHTQLDVKVTFKFLP